jgi:hypothetical protein
VVKRGSWREMSVPPPELWIGLVEVRPLSPETYGSAGAFTYILTWACDAAEFRKKAEFIVATIDLYVVGVEQEELLADFTERRIPSDEMEDMIQRAESNPNAIVWGTCDVSRRCPFDRYQRS